MIVIDGSLVGKMLCRHCQEMQTSMSRRADPQRRMHRGEAAMHSERAVLRGVCPAAWHKLPALRLPDINC
ncbi:hypothetical protein A9975_08040 [Cupriavidus sp. UME77]|nr:hypothetical protein [Cupriavidus sp. UME77]